MEISRNTKYDGLEKVFNNRKRLIISKLLPLLLKLQLTKPFLLLLQKTDYIYISVIQ